MKALILVVLATLSFSVEAQWRPTGHVFKIPSLGINALAFIYAAHADDVKSKQARIVVCLDTIPIGFTGSMPMNCFQGKWNHYTCTWHGPPIWITCPEQASKEWTAPKTEPIEANPNEGSFVKVQLTQTTR